jgi:transcriptional regulator with XRE-family HTH domain
VLDVFGRRLRAYRKLKHWTQVELAEKVGVSVAIIGGLERGTRHPTKALLDRLCEVLQVSPAELLGEDSTEALQPVQETRVE